MWTFITFAVGTAAAVAANPTVKIAAGTLEGGICANNPEAMYFKSIPYAQPPVSSLRFAAPKPFTQAYQGGSRSATHAAPACIQFGTSFVETGATSEDCLYIDVWAPANATNTSALPVRAWVFGGSNTAGGALMVSINYRLGPLGFLALKEAGIGGNMAIQDLLLALQWIQDNIAAFGGDPKKVMLHGQSAGAMDSFVVATLPQAAELFSSVVLESGGGRDQPLIERGEELGQSYSKGLNCSVSEPTCLSSVLVSALQSTFNTLPLLNGYSLPALAVNTIDAFSFEPYVDGRIVPIQPSQAGVNVPAIFGSDSQDGSLFAFAQFAGAPEAATAQNYTTFLTENFGSAAPLIEQYYPLSAFKASPFPAFTAMGTVMTSASYLCTAHRGARTAIAKSIPAWVYLFDHSPKCPWLPGVPEAALPLLGASHTCEIPFMLGNTANLPQPNGNCTMSPDEQALSRFMASTWTTFAATQQPTANKAEWPALSGPNDTVGITFANTTGVGTIDYSACQVWDQVYAAQVAAANNGSHAGSGTAGGATATGVSTTPSTGAASRTRLQNAMVVFGVAIAGISFV